MLNIFSYFFSFNFLINADCVEQLDNEMTIRDYMFSQFTGTRTSNFPLIEQDADLILFDVLSFSKDIWSIFFHSNLFIVFLLLILVLPLLYCFFIIVFLFLNQLNLYYFGNLSLFEEKNINFSILTKPYWRLLWTYAYNITPRYHSNIEKKNHQ